jgi:RHS repeat-associated protein
MLAECRYEDDDLVEESYYDGRWLKIDHGPSGEILSVENNDATLSYERDALMRISVARANGLELHYAHNTRGDCTRLTASSGRTIDYEWDGRGRLVKMIDSSAGTYEYAYDARDLVVAIRMPNGCSQHFTYDQRHRMISRRVARTDGSEICTREFSYDACGRLTRYVDSLRGTRTYEYDVTGFLSSFSDNGQLVRFEHDANGNLLTTRTGDAVTYAAGDRATRVGADAVEYDARGNVHRWRSSDGESRFEYSGEGWLKRSVLANGTVAEYEYDAMARRTAKTVNGRRTEFDWNGVHLLSERTAGDLIEYLFMPGSFFLAGVTRGGRHYSYVFDQLGTPTELIDDGGEIAWSADYAPHGEITTVRVDKVPQPFRFVGQYCDEHLGWHYNRFRYYHPVLGRFTSPDPVGFSGGTNLYRYAPNPVNWADPFGLSYAPPGMGPIYTCEVISKCDWGPEMMTEAQKKTNGVNQKGCNAIVTGPCDRPPDQKDFYMKNCVPAADKAKVEASLKSQNDSCKSQQVDHIQEVQCGGKNECDNLAPLVQTVNGSFGSQIKSCRDQLAAQGVTGTVRMAIDLVDIRDADAATLKNHGKEPCDDDETRCP